MNKTSKCVEGTFYGYNVVIVDGRVIRMPKSKTLPISEYKNHVNKIAQYLIDEGFVTELVPRIELY